MKITTSTAGKVCIALLLLALLPMMAQAQTMPIPVDEDAIEMEAAHDSQGGLERVVVMFCIIAAGIGLVISFLGFLKHIRTLILAVIVLLLSGVQIYFISQTSGFTFYLPSVVGWKWAAIWFACFTVFLLVQIYIYMMTLKCITPIPEVVGNSIIVPLISVLLLFVALLASIFFMGIENYIFRIFIGIQAANAVFVLIYSIVKIGFVRGIIYTIVFTSGMAAIGLMAYDVIVVAVVALFGLFFTQNIITKYAQGGFTQVKVRDSSGNIRYRWGDEIQPGDEKMS